MTSPRINTENGVAYLISVQKFVPKYLQACQSKTHDLQRETADDAPLVRTKLAVAPSRSLL
jgi:hypothetical protein